MEFRDRLREEMNHKRLIAKELAAKAGISVNTLNMYLGYRGSIPAADVAVNLAQALSVTVEYLMTGKEGLSWFELEEEREKKIQSNQDYNFDYEEEDQSIFLKGKGKHIEVRSNSDISNAYLQKNELTSLDADNLGKSDVSQGILKHKIISLLDLLSEKQLKALYKIIKSFSDEVIRN